MAEAVWTGFLRLSLVSCPVSLAPATTDSGVIELEQLNPATGNPVAERFVDARTGDVVPAEALVQAYHLEGSRYVPLSEDELNTVAGPEANILEIVSFVSRNQVDRALLQDAYYLYPEGPLASDTLHALRLAMQRSGSEALAHIRFGDRARTVLIEPYGAGMMVLLVRPPRVLEPPEFVERPDEDIPTEMVEIAEGIVGRRRTNLDPEMLGDRHQQRLREVLERKTGGQLPAAPRPSAAAVSPAAARPAAATVSAAPSRPAAAPSPSAPPSQPPPQATPSAPTASAPVPPDGLAGAPVDAAQAAVNQPPVRDAAEMAAAVATAAAPPPEPTAPPPSPEAPEGLAGAPVASTPPAATAPPPEPTLESPPEPPAAEPAAQEAEEEAEPGREIASEILLHIMGLGDRRFIEPGWAGHPGSRRQIEAISIRPREGLSPSALEFRVFAQEGRATAWVSNGNYAGTRGRNLPLTGFAVRPAVDQRDRYDIVYEGCFFDGGVVGPKRNGEICTSPVANDPLEAVRVTILEKAGSEGGGQQPGD